MNCIVNELHFNNWRETQDPTHTPHSGREGRVRLEALAVDDGRAGLVVLLLGDPHLLEGGERGQDGAADPDRVLALGRGNDLDLHALGSQGDELLLHAVSQAGVHGGAAREHDVAVQVLADVDVALHDRVVGGLVDAGRLHAEERGLEESLGAAEALVADGDHLAVRQLVGLLEGRGRGSGLHLLLEVEGDVGELLLDVTHNLALGGGGEGVAALGEDLHHVVSQIAASQIQTEDGVRQGVALVDGDGVRDTIARVEDNAGGAARGVQGEHGLDGDVHGRGVEGLEHDLGHLLTVGLGVEGGLGEEDGVLLRGNAELVVEGVVPDLLHVIPVGDNAVLNGVLQGQDTTLGLGLVTDVAVLLAHADHDTLVAGAADNRGEDGAGGIVTGETGLAHAGAVVDDQSSNLAVAHDWFWVWREELEHGVVQVGK
eukprot:m.123980 g.123980  ORF g.123980 m.123980 type:complete len:429 (+) comp16274_c1_seq2:170-1456(+)